LQVAEDDEFRRPMPGIYRASLEGQRDWLIGLLEEGAP
jgi:hypothetical protein